jgi:pimeloyl-ACP methyl ester carboxylesterase
MSHTGNTTRLRHGRVGLALHTLSLRREDSSLPPLLLLHALGAGSDAWHRALPAWDGGIHGLDFAGHGASDWILGGGYFAEHFLADADIALAALGDRAAVAGAGIGAYVALLLAGSRPERIPAALLFPGAGLAGAGSMPDFDAPEIVSLEVWEARIASDAADYPQSTDPRVAGAGRDFRPDHYVAAFAQKATCLLFGEFGPDSDQRDGGPMPSWWTNALRAARSESVSGRPETAFARLAERAR